MFCGVPPSDLIRNMDIDHRGVLTWTRWICDTDGSVFTVGIGQFWVVGRRSWDCVIWRHSCSYIYIKHHTIEKYLIETSNRRCNYFHWWWVCMIMKTSVPCGMTSLRHWRQTNVGNDVKKTWFTFDCHILPYQGHIGARIIPCRCIVIKKKIFNEVRVDPYYRQPILSLLIGLR